jgi:hypothetical protein
MNVTKLTYDQRKEAIKQKANIQTRMQKKEFDFAPWEECPIIAREVDNSKITSRFWERRVANELGWKTDPTRETDNQDYGDIMIKNGIIGIDNVELKSTEKLGNYKISGGQMRFYEDIPWYMFLVLDDNFVAHLYIMHKDDIYNEMFTEKKGIGSVSQGSGKTTHSSGQRFSQDEKLQLIKETFEKKNDILWGFGINGKTDKPTKNRWDKQYKTTIDQLKDWEAFKKSRNK